MGCRGVGVPWQDRVDPDAPRAQLSGQREGQGIDRALGRRVHARRQVRVRAEDRADIDDAAGRPQQFDGLAHCKQVTQHVQVELRVEGFFSQVIDHLEHSDTRIIDQNVQSPVLGANRFEQAYHVC